MVDVMETGVIVITVTPPTGPAAVLDPLGKPGTPGLDGLDGWTPVLAVVTDGTRRVHQLIDWIGGEGGKPANTIGMYVGVSGLVTLIADAVDIRGTQGVQGPQGVQGDPGAVIIGEGADVLTGDGPPDNSLGADNQLYLDNIASTIYKKLSGVWVLQTSLKGQQGDPGPQGADGDPGPQGAPGTAGADGAQGIQGEQGDAGPEGPAGQDGATIHVILANPTSGLGNVGDIALNASTYHIFDKTGPTTWTDRGSLRGADGVIGQDGSTIRFGSTVPDNSLGNDDDLYLRTTTGDLYTKSAGAWTLAINLVGPEGDQGPQGIQGVEGKSIRFGTGAPDNSLGNNGDVYIATDTDHYYTKSAGAWTDEGTLRGSNFLTGSGAPSGALGEDGDTYMNTANGDLYGPKSAGSWGSVVGNLRGPQGNTGTAGSQGLLGGFRWLFDSTAQNTTGLAAGDFRVNDTVIGSVTHVYLNSAALNGSPLLDWISDMLNNTNTVKGQLVFQLADSSAGNDYAIFSVTAVDISSASFADLTVQTNAPTNISLFTNNTAYALIPMQKGSKGDAGTNGTNGTNGTDGVRGSRWTSGAGAPGTISGQLNNDFYLNTSNGDVYQLVSGTWTVVDNITGPTGATGQGVPTGGSTGQVLKKNSATDYDTVWADETGGGGSGTGASHDIQTLYEYDNTSQVDADPGTGKFRTGNLMTPPGTPSGTQVVTLYISTTDKNGVDMTSFFDNWTPSNWLNAYVSSYTTSLGINSIGGRMMARITSIVSATGYRKVSLRFASRSSNNPWGTNAVNYPFFWSSARKNAPIAPLSAFGSFNNSSNFGIPGFIPLKQKAANLNTLRMYVMPFTIKEPIISKGARAIVTTAPSSGSWRAFLAHAMNIGSDGFFGWSAAIGDSGLLPNNGTGAKNLAWTVGNIMLAPGHYMLLLATNSHSGTLGVQVLSGTWADKSIVQFPGAASWSVNQQMVVNSGADWSASALTADYTVAPGITSLSLGTTVTDQHDVPCVMEWEAA